MKEILIISMVFVFMAVSGCVTVAPQAKDLWDEELIAVPQDSIDLGFDQGTYSDKYKQVPYAALNEKQSAFVGKSKTKKGVKKTR